MLRPIKIDGLPRWFYEDDEDAAPIDNTITIERLGLKHKLTATHHVISGCNNAFLLERTEGPITMFKGCRKAIVKMEEPNMTSEYNRELDTFRILKEYQGLYLPHFYGEIIITKADGTVTRGILISYPDGKFLTETMDAPIHRSELEPQVKLVVEAIVKKGVLNRTVDFSNAIWVNGGIQLVDWHDVIPFGIRDKTQTVEEDKELYIRGEPWGFANFYGQILSFAKVDKKKYGY